MTQSEIRRRLFREMVRIRVAEESLADHYAEQEMRCPVHLCIGQEAIAAGACAALERADMVMSGHRSHGHYIAKGGDMRAMVAEIYGKATGCAKGKGGSMHLIDLDAGFCGAAPIVGSTIPIAAGLAFTSQLRGDDLVTMVFFGDGACEAGVLHETLNFAALRKLPLVLVCENNLYSVYSPMNVRQPLDRSIVGLAQAHNLHCASGDGNDVEEVYRLAVDAVERARRGEGPSFLEFSTYRWREHCGPNYDNDLGYRTEAEYLDWREHDSIEAYRTTLLGAGADEVKLGAITDDAQAEIDAAIQYAKQSPFPAAEAAATEVYSRLAEA